MLHEVVCEHSHKYMNVSIFVTCEFNRIVCAKMAPGRSELLWSGLSVQYRREDQLSEC